MTSITLTSNGLSEAKPASLERAKQLAATLLSERGEASGALVARQLHEALGALDVSDRHGFQRYVATEFHPDKAALRAAAERYLADGTAEAAATLAQAADPPRVENRRVSGGRTVQRHVLYLGEINDSQRAAWCQTIEAFDEGGQTGKQIALFPEDRAAPPLDCAM
jgi:hypothetical protein